METWVQTGLAGSDAGRNALRVSATATAGRSIDENQCGPTGTCRSRSRSLPTTAQSQRDYLQSIRAIAHAYSEAERNQTRGGYVPPVDVEPDDGCMTRLRCATMIDTHHRDNRGRMDSELTSDSDHTFEMSPGAPLRTGDSSDVFAMPASDDEKSKIISRRLQELDSAQRSWKKRVADYVHGLPNDKGNPAEGGKVQDPKRRRLWSTGCDRLPWEINSTDGVTPRQRMATVSSDSTFSCSQLSTSSSRDSIQHWVDSIDGQEDLDATLTAGDAQRRSSNPLVGRKTSNGSGVHPKVRSQSLDDDLGLGADAESVSDSGKGEDLVKTKQVIGPRDKMLKRRLTNSEIISLASQTKALQSRRKQLQRMGSSALSDNSVASVSDLLFARNDPEELLLSLGFGGQKEPDPLARIPSRFMKRPSIAKGISVQNFLMVSETPDQKLGFSLHGGLRGLGAIVQSSHYAMGGSVQLQGCGMDGVEGDLGARKQSSKEGIEVHDTATSKDSLEDRVQEIHRSGWSDRNSKTNDDTRQKNNFNLSTESDQRSKDVPDSHESITSSSKNASEHLLRSISNVSSVESVTSTGSDFYISDSSDSDWDYEEVDPGLGSSRSSEDHRRSRISRMVMPEPLLPPVHEELEVTTTPQLKKLLPIPAQDINQELVSIETLGKGSQVPSESLLVSKGRDVTPVEKKAASSTLDSVPHRLIHTQESFEIEEISSTENQEEGSPVNKSADKVTEKGPLVRTDSAQSDSSGFADEVMESTVISTSPCFEDCNGHGSTGRDYSDETMPEMGNKLIQTSFDGFGLLESFDRDDWLEEGSDAVSGRTVVTAEDEKISNSSPLSSNERIARSRKSFRESRSSYDHIGSTMSGLSVSSMDDSPFDVECDIVMPRTLPIPRQRSETYPTAADKQEIPPGPKTVVEILTTLQENIKQASEAKTFMEAKDSGKPGRRRPLLSKMKTVDLDNFPADDIPSLMESVEAIIGRTKQASKSTHNKQDQDRELPSQVESVQEVRHPSAEIVEVLDDTIKLSPKLAKRKSSQILRVPTLPCLDEENTPVNSRHSSVSDLLPKLTSTHSTDDHTVPESVPIPDTASSIPSSTHGDFESPKLDCADLKSDTETGESMLANADSIGDLGDLEEEMKYLEHVESLLRHEGRLLEEASPPRSQFKTSNNEPHQPQVEETIVPVTEFTEESCLPNIPSDSFNQRVNNNNISSLFEVDTIFPNHSGDCLNIPDIDNDNSDIAASQIIPTASSSSSAEPGSPEETKLVESSMCLYLSPTPFVIDVTQMTSSNNIETEHLCKTPDAEIVPKRYRTSVEVDLDGSPSDEKSRKPSEMESISRVKSEDNFHDMKLIQRALYKYKNDLFELESLSERVHSRRSHDNEEEDGGAMELDSVRGLRRQIMDEVEIMEGQLAMKARQAGAQNNFSSESDNDVVMATDCNTEIIQEMVKLLDEQRSLRRILNDVETTHPLSSPSEASTIPDLSAVGSGEWAEPVCEEGVADQDGGDDKTEMMDALRSLRLEVQQQREAARREMNCAVKEAKDKEIEQLKDLLQEQMLQDKD
ncbi:uncharacterized protein [Asterias amurensis]|uniref:uncharacterized protein isoform X2 n=1 Tax=Asterias amurensis TaxID=7602 RepID=UPI003AB10F12